MCVCVCRFFILAESPRVILFESKIDLMLCFIHMLTRLDARRTQEDQYIILSQSNERVGTARWWKISSAELLWQTAKLRDAELEMESRPLCSSGPHRFWNDIKGGDSFFFISAFLLFIQLPLLPASFLQSLLISCVLSIQHLALYSTVFLQHITTYNNERLTMVYYLR